MGKNNFKLGVILAYILIVANLLYGFIVTPFLINQLSSSNYGAYKTISSLIGTISVLDFGISSAVVRFVSKYYSEKDKESESKYLGASFLQSVVIIIFLSIGGLILFFQLENLYGNSDLGINIDPGLSISKNVYLLLLLNSILSIPGEIFNSIIVGHKKYAFANFTKVIKIVIQLVLILLLVPIGLWNGSAITVCVAILLTTISFVLIDFIYVTFVLKVRISFRLKGTSKWIFKESFIFMLLTFVQSVLIQFEGNLDIILIAKYINSDFVTLYSVALLFYSMFNQLSTAISNLLLPKVSQIIADGGSTEDLENLTIKVGRIQFMLLGGALLGFISLGNMFIFMWQGDGFGIVWPLTIILLTATIIPLCQNGCLAILRAKNKLLFRTLAIVVGTIFNFAFTFISLSMFDCSNEMKLVFACVGTAISLIGANVIAMNIYYSKVIKINVFRIIKCIFSKTWLCLIPAFIITFIYGQIVPFSWINFVIGVCIFVLIYGVLLILYGFNEEERNSLLLKFFSNANKEEFKSETFSLFIYSVNNNLNKESIYTQVEKVFDIKLDSSQLSNLQPVFSENTIVFDETTSETFNHNPYLIFGNKKVMDYKNIVIIGHQEYKELYKEKYGFGFSLNDTPFINKKRVNINTFSRPTKNDIKSLSFFKGTLVGLLTFFACFGTVSFTTNHLPEYATIIQNNNLNNDERIICKVKPSTYPINPYQSQDFIIDQASIPSTEYFFSKDYGYNSYYSFVQNGDFVPFSYIDSGMDVPFDMFASNSLILNNSSSFEECGMRLLCSIDELGEEYKYSEDMENVIVISSVFSDDRFESYQDALGKTIDVKLYGITNTTHRTQRTFKIVGVYENISNYCFSFSERDCFFCNTATVSLGWSGLEYSFVIPTSPERTRAAYLNIGQLLDVYSYTSRYYLWNLTKRSIEELNKSPFDIVANFNRSLIRIIAIICFSVLFVAGIAMSVKGLTKKEKNVLFYRRFKYGMLISSVISILIVMISSFFICQFITNKLFTFTLMILPLIFSTLSLFVIPQLLKWLLRAIKK